MPLSIARSSLLFTLAIIGTAEAAPAPERHCGWYQNPSNANATLTDATGVWTLPADSAKPIFRAGQWVNIDGDHGYGCACVSGSADSATHTLNGVNRANARTLATCRADVGLPEPTSAKVAAQ